MKKINLLILLSIIFISCGKSDDDYIEIATYPFVEAEFGSSLNLNNLDNYANQSIPSYITKFNGQNNPITDKAVTLGRVLFYDKKLSSNNTISCASCHKQENAFSDAAVASLGVNGTTERHTMRLVNARFSIESKFFWDERAATLEIQSTMPIKNHGEMGYSGENSDGNFNDLITKLNDVGYYKELFKFVFDSEEITESKMQLALSQFIRSIQSFDSKYDEGRSLAPNDGVPFTNFTQQENQGKNLFLTPPVFNATGNRTSGGLGCNACHGAPEFDIDPNSLNNGFGGSIAGTPDVTVTRAPSLRDVVKPNGELNGPLMHTGIITSLQAVVGHYGDMTNNLNNTNLDPRLKPNGFGQQLHLTAQEINSVIAFLKTLSGNNIYVDSKWSDPF
jgi:cytochrome c peroxidase